MIEDFGTLPGGGAVKRVTIGDETLQVSILTYGARMQAVRLAGVPYSLCLGFEDLDGYLSGGDYIGAVVGRVANRIGGGRAEIDGQVFEFDRNDGGRHTLHGGAKSLSHRNYGFLEDSARVLQLGTRLFSDDNGFPGALDVTVRYEVLAGGILEIALEAKTDAPTLCNLAPHPYFNLNGNGDAREQYLFVDAVAMTATNEEKIPTGKLTPLIGTSWDHRTEKRMLGSGLDYDCNFCLSHRQQALRPVARLVGREGRVAMDIETTEPGLQVYDGAALKSPYAGIALEPQAWPDAPNHEGFPSIVLRPGEVSRQVTRLVFGEA